LFNHDYSDIRKLDLVLVVTISKHGQLISYSLN
jgi:hypothetical protein